MSEVLDERVVEMRFDNQQFEHNVNQSIQTIDRLKKSLDFDDAGSSFDNLSSAASNCDLSPLEKSVEEISVKFNMLDMVAANVMSNIVNKAVNAGMSMAKALTIDQVSAGWSKYEQKTQSVQTIMAATGQSIEEVNEQLEKLIWYADETSYDFVDMVNNIGKFTSAGVKLDVAVNSMMGISNWAAISGAGIQQASRAMFNLSQAVGMGYVGIQDWKSVELANMATIDFKENVIETAVALGTLRQEADGTIKTLDNKDIVTAETMRSTLKKGWFTSDVLNTTLNQYASFSNQVYEYQKKLNAESTHYYTVQETVNKMMEDGVEIQERWVDAFLKAQEALSFTQVINATKDAVSSGWMKTFEFIFGNYEQAKKLWTDLAQDMLEIFATSSETRNETLESLMSSNYKQMIDMLPEGKKFNDDLDKKIYDILSHSGIPKETVEALYRQYDSAEELIKSGVIDNSTLQQAFTSLSEEYSKSAELSGKLSENLQNGTVKLKDVIIGLANGYWGKEEETARKYIEALGMDYEYALELAEQWYSGYDMNWDELTTSLISNLNYQKQAYTDFVDFINEYIPEEGFFNWLKELGGRDKLVGGFQNIVDTFKNLYKTILDIKNAFLDFLGVENFLSFLIDGFYNLTNLIAYTDEEYQKFYEYVSNGGIKQDIFKFLFGEDIDSEIEGEVEHIPGLIEKISNAYDTYIANLPEDIRTKLENIKTSVSGFVTDIPNKFVQLKNKIFGIHTVEQIWDAEKNDLVEVREDVNGVIDKLKNNIMALGGGVVGLAITGVISLLKKVRDYLIGYDKDSGEFTGKLFVIFDKVKEFINMLKTIGKHVADIFNTVKRWLGLDFLKKDISTLDENGNRKTFTRWFRIPGELEKYFKKFANSAPFQAVKEFFFGKKSDDPNAEKTDLFSRIKKGITAIAESDAFRAVKEFFFGKKSDDPNAEKTDLFSRIKKGITVIAGSDAFKDIKAFFFGGETSDKKAIQPLFTRIKTNFDKIKESAAYKDIRAFFLGGEKSDGNMIDPLFTRIKTNFDKIKESAAFQAVSKFILGDIESKELNIFGKIKNALNSIENSTAFHAVKEFLFGKESEDPKEAKDNLITRISKGIKSIYKSDGFKKVQDFILGKKNVSWTWDSDLKKHVNPRVTYENIEKIKKAFTELKESAAYKDIKAFFFGGETSDKKTIQPLFTRIKNGFEQIKQTTAFQDLKTFFTGGTYSFSDNKIEPFLTRLRTHFENIKTTVSDISNYLQTKINTLVGTKAFQTIKSFLFGDYFSDGNTSILTTLFGNSATSELSLFAYNLERIKSTDWFKNIRDFLFGKEIKTSGALNSFFHYFHTLEEYQQANVFDKLKFAAQDLYVYLFGWKDKNSDKQLSGILEPVIEKIKSFLKWLGIFWEKTENDDGTSTFKRIHGAIDDVYKAITQLVKSDAFQAVKEFFFGKNSDDPNAEKTDLFSRISKGIKSVAESKAFQAVKKFFFGENNEDPNAEKTDLFSRMSKGIKSIAESESFRKVQNFILGKAHFKGFKLDEKSGKYFAVYEYENIEKIKKSFIDLKEFIKSIFSGELFKTVKNSIADFLLGPLNEEGKRTENIFKRLPAMVKSFKNSIKTFFSGGVDENGEQILSVFEQLKNKFEQLKEAHPWLAEFCKFIEKIASDISQLFKDAGGSLNLALSNLNAYLYGGEIKKKNENGIVEITKTVDEADGAITGFRKNVEKLFNGGKEKKDQTVLEQIASILGIGKKSNIFDNINSFIKTLIGINIFMLTANFQLGDFLGLSIDISSGLTSLLESFRSIAISVAILVGVLVGLSVYINWLKSRGYSSIIASGAVIILLMAALTIVANQFSKINKKVSISTSISMLTVTMLTASISLLTVGITALFFAITALLVKFKLVENHEKELIAAGGILGGILLFITLITAFSVRVVGKDQKIEHASGIWFGIAATLFGLSSFLVTIVGVLGVFYLVLKYMKPEDIAVLKKAGVVLFALVSAVIVMAGIITFLANSLAKSDANKTSFAAFFALVLSIKSLLITLTILLVGIYAFVKDKTLSEIAGALIAVGVILLGVVGAISTIMFIINKFGKLERVDRSVFVLLIGAIFAIDRIKSAVISLAAVAKITGWESMAVSLAGLSLLLTAIAGVVWILSKVKKVDGNTAINTILSFDAIIISLALLTYAIIALVEHNKLQKIDTEVAPMMRTMAGVLVFILAITGFFELLSKFVIKDQSFKDLFYKLSKFYVAFVAFSILFGFLAVIATEIGKAAVETKLKDGTNLDFSKNFSNILSLFASILLVLGMIAILAGIIQAMEHFEFDLEKVEKGSVTAFILISALSTILIYLSFITIAFTFSSKLLQKSAGVVKTDSNPLIKELSHFVSLFASILLVLGMMAILAGIIQAMDHFKFDQEKIKKDSFNLFVLISALTIILFYLSLIVIGFTSFSKLLQKTTGVVKTDSNPLIKELSHFVSLFASILLVLGMMAILAGIIQAMDHFKFDLDKILSGSGKLFVLISLLFGIMSFLVVIAGAFVDLSELLKSQMGISDSDENALQKQLTILLPLFAIMAELMVMMTPLAAIIALLGNNKTKGFKVGDLAKTIVTMIGTLIVLAGIASIFVFGIEKLQSGFEIGKYKIAIDFKDQWKALLPLFEVMAELIIMMLPLAGVIALLGNAKAKGFKVGDLDKTIAIMIRTLIALAGIASIFVFGIEKLQNGFEIGKFKIAIDFKDQWKALLPLFAVMGELIVMMLPIAGVIALLNHFEIKESTYKNLPKLIWNFIGVLAALAVIAGLLAIATAKIPEISNMKWDKLLPLIVAMGALVVVLGAAMLMFGGINAAITHWPKMAIDKDKFKILEKTLWSTLGLIGIIVSVFFGIGGFLFLLDKKLANGKIKEFLVGSFDLLGDVLLSMWKCVVALAGVLVIVLLVSAAIGNFPSIKNVDFKDVMKPMIAAIATLGLMLTGFVLMAAMIRGLSKLVENKLGADENWLEESIQFLSDVIENISDSFIKFAIAIGIIAFASELLSNLFSKIKMKNSGSSLSSFKSLVPITTAIIKAMIIIGEVMLGILVLGGVFKGIQSLGEKLGLEKGWMVDVFGFLGDLLGALFGGIKKIFSSGNDVDENKTEDKRNALEKLSDMMPALEKFLTTIRGLSLTDLGAITIFSTIMAGVFTSEFFTSAAEWVSGWDTGGNIHNVLADLASLVGPDSSLSVFLSAIRELTMADASQILIFNAIMFNIFTSELIKSATEWVGKWDANNGFDISTVLSDLGGLVGEGKPLTTFLNALGNLDPVKDTANVQALSDIMAKVFTSELIKSATEWVSTWGTGADIATPLGELEGLVGENKPLTNFLKALDGIDPEKDIPKVQALSDIMAKVFTSELATQATTWVSTWSTGGNIKTPLEELGGLVGEGKPLTVFLTAVKSLDPKEDVEKAGTLSDIMVKIFESELISKATTWVSTWSTGKQIGDVLNELGELVGKDKPLTNFLDTVKTLTPDDKTSAGLLSDIVLEVFKSELFTKASEFVGTIKTGGDLDQVVTGLNSVITKLKPFLTECATLKPENVEQATYLPKILGAVVSSQFLTGVSKISKWVSDSTDYVELFNNITKENGILDAVEVLNEKIKGKDFSDVANASDAISSVFNLLTVIGNVGDIQDTDSIWNNIKGLIGKDNIVMTDVAEALNLIITTVVPEIAELQKALQNEENNIDPDYLKNTIGVYVDLINTIYTLSEATNKHIDFGNFEQIGNYVIEGLVNALSDEGNLTTVYEVAVKVGERLLAGLQVGTGVSSPSKYAYAIGQFVAQGLYLGIKDGSEANYRLAQLFGEETINSLEKGLSKHTFNMVTEDLIDENRFNMNMSDFMDELGNIDFEALRSFLHEKFEGLLDDTYIDGFVNQLMHDFVRIPETLDEQTTELMLKISHGDFGTTQDAILDALEEELGSVDAATAAWKNYNDVIEGNIKLNEEYLRQHKENPPMTYEEYMEMEQHTQEGFDKFMKGEFHDLAAQNGTTVAEEMMKHGYDPMLTSRLARDYFYSSLEPISQEMIEAEKNVNNYKRAIDAGSESVSDAEQEQQKLIANLHSGVDATDSYTQHWKNLGKTVDETGTAGSSGTDQMQDEIEETAEVIQDSAEEIETAVENVTDSVSRTEDEQKELVKRLHSGVDALDSYTQHWKNVGSVAEENAKLVAEARQHLQDTYLNAASTIVHDYDKKLAANDPARKLLEILQDSAENNLSPSDAIYKELEYKPEEVNVAIDKIQRQEKLTESEIKQLERLSQDITTKGLYSVGQNRKELLALIFSDLDNAQWMYENFSSGFDVKGYNKSIDEIASANQNLATSVSDTGSQVSMELKGIYEYLPESLKPFANVISNSLTESFDPATGKIKVNLEKLLSSLPEEIQGIVKESITKGTGGKSIELGKDGLFELDLSEVLSGLTKDQIKENAGDIGAYIARSLWGNFENFNQTGVDLGPAAEKVGEFIGRSMAGDKGSGLLGELFTGILNIASLFFGTKTEIESNPLEPHSDNSELDYTASYIQEIAKQYKILDETLGTESLAAQGYRHLVKGERMTIAQARELEKLWQNIMQGFDYGTEYSDISQNLMSIFGIDYSVLRSYQGPGGKFDMTPYTSEAVEYASSYNKETYTTAQLLKDIYSNKWGVDQERRDAFEIAGIDYDKTQELYKEWIASGKSAEKFLEENAEKYGDHYGFITDEEKKAIEQQKKWEDTLNHTPEGAFRSVADFLDGVKYALSDNTIAENFKTLMTVISDSLSTLTISNASDFKSVGDFLTSIRYASHESSAIIKDFKTIVNGIKDPLEELGKIEINNIDALNAVASFAESLSSIVSEDNANFKNLSDFLTSVRVITNNSTDISTKFNEFVESIKESVATLGSIEIQNGDGMNAITGFLETLDSYKESGLNNLIPDIINGINTAINNFSIDDDKFEKIKELVSLFNSGNSGFTWKKNDGNVTYKHNPEKTNGQIVGFGAPVVTDKRGTNTDKYLGLYAGLDKDRFLHHNTAGVDMLESVVDATNSLEINTENADVINNLSESLTEMAEATSDVDANDFSSFVDAVGEAFASNSAMNDSALIIINALLETFRGMYGEFYQIGIDIIQQVADGMVSNVAAVQSAASTIGGKIKESFATFTSENAAQMGMDFVTGVQQGIEQSGTLIKDALNNIFGTGEEESPDAALEGQGPTESMPGSEGITSSESYGTKLGTQFVHDVAEAINSSDEITNAVSGSFDFITNMPETLSNVTADFSQFLPNVASGVEDTADQAMGVISGIAESIRALFESMVPDGYGLAVNFMMGLMNGLNGGFAGVYAAGVGVGVAGSNGVAEGADTHSPSKKTIKVGEYLCEGLVIGLNNGMSSVYNAGFDSGLAVLEGTQEALDIHSPSGEGFRIAENYYLGIHNGAVKVLTSLKKDGEMIGESIIAGTNYSLDKNSVNYNTLHKQFLANLDIFSGKTNMTVEFAERLQRIWQDVLNGKYGVLGEGRNEKLMLEEQISWEELYYFTQGRSDFDFSSLLNGYSGAVADLDEQLANSSSPIRDIIQGVYNGIFGVGQERVKMLEELGYDSSIVQGLVYDIENGAVTWSDLDSEYWKRVTDSITEQNIVLEDTVDNAEDLASNLIDETNEVAEAVGEFPSEAAEEVKENTEELAEAVGDAADKASDTFTQKTNINSPSKLFAKYGSYLIQGLVNGISDELPTVEGSIQNMGDTVSSLFSEAISNIDTSLASDLNQEPVIRPVVDMTDIYKAASSIDSELARNKAISIGADINESGYGNGSQSSAAAVYNFYQTNNSPKALSRLDIYRQTRNQFAQLRLANTYGNYSNYNNATPNYY